MSFDEEKDETVGPSAGEPAIGKGFDYSLSPEPAAAPQPLLEQPTPQPTPEQMPEQLAPRRRGRWLAPTAAALALVIVGGLAGSASTYYLQSRSPVQTVTLAPGAASTVRPVVLQGQAGAVADVYKRVGPAIVRIETVSTATGGTQLGPFGFRSAPRAQAGQGSGIIFDPHGYVLTNFHVIDGAKKLTVVFQDGGSVAGTVVGTDPGNDMAVVKIDPGTRHLTVASLGDSDQMEIGDPVIAIGAPFGLDHTVTTGIVSGRHRGDQVASPQGRYLPDLIQTDAAINPGNSGGALLNAAGEVVGITTAIQSPVGAFIGIGYAIPVNQAKAALPSLVAGKQPQHPWLGLGGDAVSNVKDKVQLTIDHGVYVQHVYKGTASEQAGLQGASYDAQGRVTQAGDVITAIDSQQVNTVQELSSYLATRQVGDTVNLKVWRSGKTIDLKATLAALPAQMPDQPPTNPNQ